jgi:hypothetical protein
MIVELSSLSDYGNTLSYSSLDVLILIKTNSDSMQLMYVVILQLEMIILMYAKDYSPVELNRIRIVKLYRNSLLTRPSTKNVGQTIVAIGLGIIEVAGIDPQKQVSIHENKLMIIEILLLVCIVYA